MCFWASSLPLSLWAMQANWNGLFLAEPRFRIAVIFAVTGVLVQAGLALLSQPLLNSLVNVLFFGALTVALRQANYVMHPPPSPIFSSGVPSIMFFFVASILLGLASAGFLARAWLKD
jgi:intracellular septation protein A